MPCTNPAVGGNARIVIQMETCFKEEVSPVSGIVLPFATCDIAVTQPPNQVSNLRSGRHSSRPWRGNQEISGTLTGNVGTDSIYYILQAMFSAPDSTGTVHEFTIDSTAQNFIISKEFLDVEQYHIYRGCRANSLSFAFNSANELMYNLSFQAASETRQETPYDDSPEDLGAEQFYFNIDMGSAVEEGGVSTDIFDEINLNIANPVSMIYGLSGGGTATYASSGKVEVTGNVVGVFLDGSLINKGANFTETSLDLILSKGTNYLRFYMPEMEVSRNSPPISNGDIIKQDISYVAYYENSDEQSDIVVQVSNDRTY